jgi:hypothetical protein
MRLSRHPKSPRTPSRIRHQKFLCSAKKMLAIAPASRVEASHVAAQQIFSAFPAGIKSPGRCAPDRQGKD